MHEHKKLGINKSLGLLLQTLGVELSTPKLLPKIEPSAQLGMRTPLGKGMSVCKKALAQGLLTGIHKERKGCPNTWTKH